MYGLDNKLPRLKASNHTLTSPATDEYNCIGWAAGEDDRWWWPFGDYYYWPEGVQVANTVDAFVEAFATLGYKRCESGGLDQGLEKVAIYARNGLVTHMARQLDTGRWTSKLGNMFDIEHENLPVVSGGIYGAIAEILARDRPQTP